MSVAQRIRDSHEGASDEGFDEVAPNASSMIESMRAYGYTLATAVSDLVDNSIAAGASAVWIDLCWAGQDSWLTIIDDGAGMGESELRDAMRLGSRSPLETREARDLGRFGLGLKTASLSQCRRLTVVSRTSGGREALRRWDLEHLSRPNVVGWQLLKSRHPDSQARTDRLKELESGTAVVWEVLDRVVHGAEIDDQAAQRHFLGLISGLESHLAMVFHRFLGGPRASLKIFLNGSEVGPWDPFAESHPATSSTPEEQVLLPGYELPVVVKGFVLPHKDMLGADVHEVLSGPAGWNAQQGFYVYRNERLIVAGSWLGLGGTRPWTKEEHYKLARIRLDVPNAMDHEWHLDVKKSSAYPPPAIRKHLRGLAQSVRMEARSVFAHRGSYGKRARPADFVRPWKAGHRAGRTTYSIDRSHPVVAAVLSSLDSRQVQPVETMLRIVEETVPVQQIWLDSAETPDGSSPPFFGATSRERAEIIRSAYLLVRHVRSLGHVETIETLMRCEEFADDESLAILQGLEDGEPNA